MTQSQESTSYPRCPRCGGRMYKPGGSNLYWHADNNHPPCEITNVVEASLTITAPAKASQGETAQENNGKK